MAGTSNFTTIDPSLIENDDGQIISKQNSTNADKEAFLLDEQWAKQAFLINDADLTSNANDVKMRYWSTAANKFTDTRMGGNIGINARPQFTWYSDIRVKGRLSDRADVSIQNVGGNHGMGRYYSEAIDDNSQTVYLRMGQPQFSSLMGFFKTAFDPNMTALARTGRGLSIWHTAGQVVGTIAAFVAFPAISSTIMAGRVLSMFFTRPTSKFYTLKPAMHLYWNAVNMLVNAIAVNKGILPRFMTDAVADQTQGTPYKLDQGFLTQLHEMMPDMFTDGYGFDMFAIANRAQRVANDLYSKDYEKLNNGTETDFINTIQKQNQDKVNDPPGEHTLGNFINEVLKFGYYNRDETDNRVETSPKIDPTTGETTEKEKASFLNYFDAEFREGSQFAAFKVEHTGTVSESFGNSVTESDLSQKFNSTSSQSRQARFSLAEGNVGDGVIANAVEGTIGAAAEVASGALDGVTLGIFGSLKGLAGSGFIDIPKHYQSSNVTLPRSTYKMQLISPYGNPISQMQNIYIPLAMILAAALPLSTGKQSYTSPFLVQMFDRGRCQVQLGMIDSLNIQRGTANLPFTNRGQATSIEVTFSVTDLSTIMHMPISAGTLFGADMTLDEDNILMDYLAVLAGQDMYSQIYTLPKAKLAFAKKLRQLQRLTSPAYWASFVHEETTTGALRYIVPGQILEAMLPGAEITRGR